MKAMDIIDRVDLMEPNQYSPEQKLLWLSGLDGRIYLELLCKFEENAEMSGSAPYISGQEELLIPEPYGQELYYYYLQAMIAAENAETGRYNKRIAMFNSLYRDFCRQYLRSHRPGRAGGEFIF